MAGFRGNTVDGPIHSNGWNFQVYSSHVIRPKGPKSSLRSDQRSGADHEVPTAIHCPFELYLIGRKTCTDPIPPKLFLKYTCFDFWHEPHEPNIISGQFITTKPPVGHTKWW